MIVPTSTTRTATSGRPACSRLSAAARVLIAVCAAVVISLSPVATAQPPAAPPAAQLTPAAPPSAAPPTAAEPAAPSTARAPVAARPTYWSRDFSFQSVDIATVIARLGWLGIRVPVETEGTVTVDATVGIPFGALANPRAYRLQGTLTSPRLRVESVVLADANVRFQLTDGTLRFNSVTGTVIDADNGTSAGQVAGQAAARLIPPGPLSVSLQLRQLDLPYVLQRLGTDDLQMTGKVTGQVQLTNQLRTAATWPLWSGQGSIRVDGFQWQDRPAVQLLADQVQIAGGQISSDQLAVNHPSMRLTGDGVVDTQRTATFRLNVDGDAVALDELFAWGTGTDAPAQTSGQLGVSLIISGDLSPFTWQAEGTLRAPQAQLAGVQLGTLAHRLKIDRGQFELQLLQDVSTAIAQDVRIGDITARYQATDAAWQLDELSARIGGGQLSGSGRWITAGQGKHQVDLRWSDLSIDYLWNRDDRPPIHVQAATSGSLQWSAPADQLDRPAAHQLDATVQLQQLTVDERAVGQLTAQATARRAQWQASATGTLLSGEADLQLTAQIPADAQWQDVIDPATAPIENAAPDPEAPVVADADAAADAENPAAGSYRLRIAGAAIPLAELLGQATDDAAEPLQLDVAVTGGLLPFDFQADGTVRSQPLDVAGLVLGPLAHRFSIDDQQLRLNALADAQQETILRSLEADYAIDDEALRLSRLQGQLWGGQISGSAIWITGQQGRHQADLTWRDLALDYRIDNRNGRPLQLHADTSGSVQWSVAADQIDRPAAHQLTAVAELQRVTLQGRPIGRLSARASATAARWQAAAQGTLFDGVTNLQLAAQIPAAAQWPDVLAMAQQADDRAAADDARAAATAAGSGSYRLQIQGAAIPLQQIPGAPAADAESLDAAADNAAADAAPTDAAEARGGPLQLDVLVSGGLFPLDFRAEGTVRAPAIEAAGWSLGPLAHHFQVDAQRLALRALPDADASVAVTALQADYAIDADAVRLNRIQGSLWGGRFGGEVVWMTADAGRHQAQLQWQAVNIHRALPGAAQPPRPVRLVTSGQLAWSAPVDALDQPAQHRLQATAHVSEVVLDEQALGQARLTINGEQAQWSAAATGTLLGRPVDAQLSAVVPRDATWQTLLAAEGQADDDAAGGRYRLQLQTAAFPVADAVALLNRQAAAAADDAPLLIDLNVAVSGTLSPLEWQVDGTVKSPQTMVGGFDFGPLAHRLNLDRQTLRLQPLSDAPPGQVVGMVTAEYAIDDDAWRLNPLQAQLWGGEVRGSGVWVTGEGGRHQAQLQWSDLTLQGSWAIVGDDASRLSAATSGRVQWSVPAAAVQQPAAHQLQASLQVAQLSVDEAPIGDLAATLTADGGEWNMAGDGNLLGGPAQIRLQTSLPDDASWQQIADQATAGSLPVSASLHAGPLPASRLFGLWQPGENARRWSGQVRLTWHTVDSDLAGPRTSHIELAADGLQYGPQRLTDRLTAQVLIVGDQMVVQSFEGRFAGGRIGATGRWGLGASASQVAVQLTSVDASRAVLAVSPDLAAQIAGRVSGRLLVSDGDGLLVTGSLELRDAVVDRLSAGTLRTHVTANVAIPSRRWAIRLRDMRGRIAKGSMRGHAALQSSAGGGRIDLDSRWEMDGVDFEDLLDELGGSSRTLGRGVLTGTLTLSGRRIQSVRDLRGELQASLAGSDATAIPGLTASQNYLGAFSLRSTRFDSGEIEGRIANGELQIRELWLVGDQLRVWGDGEVALGSGRLDLDVVAATGNFQQANPLLLTLAQQVALDATLPVSLVLRANELLSDRVVRLQLYGTYRRPQVRIQPVRNLGENAARFFLRSIAGDLIPGTAATAGATFDRDR